jgi:hypothetical protein
LKFNPLLDTVAGMETRSWRDRVLAEDELLLELQEKASLAAKRRAAALLEGVAELGTVAAVAKELGKSHTAIDNAIKRHGPKQA